jgi:hypothetical protein
VHALEVAAESPQALQLATAELGETEQDLIEAARFYLEQVLFAAPDATAYRVLGVPADAGHETIRTHHRWLQRWLHPDRALAGDASVFATRVNQAFAQLRTPELRHAYDVRLAEARLAGASAPLAVETVRRWEAPDEIPSGVGRRSRWLLGAALASCLVLAVLIIRNSQDVAPWQPGDDEALADEGGESREPPVADRGLGALRNALAVAPVARPASVAATTAGTNASPEPVVRDGETPSLVHASMGGQAPIEMAAKVPAPSAGSPPLQRIQASAAPLSRATRPAEAEARSAVQGVVAPQVAMTAAESLPVAKAPAIVAAAETPPAVPAAPATSAPDPEIVLQRMRLAEQRVNQVVGYLGARPGAVPMWNDPGVEAQATRLREQLNARSGTLELTSPAWRVRADRASLDAGYRCRPASGGSCEGRFVVDLVWREGLWLVRDVSVAPSAPSA